MYYQYEIAEGTTTLGARLIKKSFTVQQCAQCQVHSLVPRGESWEHDCQHQLVHLTAQHAMCTGCTWRYSKVDQYRSERSVRGVFDKAHTHQPHKK